MSKLRVIADPPHRDASLPVERLPAGWWHDSDEDGRIICDLCPRECHLKPGDRGFCFVRQNVDGDMRLTTYGRSTGFCIDPIEKKPLNHFLPGTPVLSFGTAGCNLGCKFCQNWDISKSREVERLSELALPDTIAAVAVRTGCRSVAFTYNDPVIWAEYAIDTAKACRAAGIRSVAVTAGYISPAARPAFFHAMDAANVDLKAFTEDFYHRITYSRLQPVLDTLRWLKRESDVWFEITNLVIPDANDSPDEIRQMCDWIVEAVGPDVPVHFSAFHPDFRMLDRPRTPPETLQHARQIAMRQGVKFAYVGNVHDVDGQSTWCPRCSTRLIERDWYQLGAWRMRGNRCSACGQVIAGRFEAQPGSWGAKRLPVRIREHISSAATLPVISPTPKPSGTPAMPPVIARPQLQPDQEQVIRRAACEIVAATVQQRPVRLPDGTLAGTADMIVAGVFVTVKKHGALRGCCGAFGAPMPLLQSLTESARRTAVDDPRFSPVAPEELSSLTLDVSLLFHPEDVVATGEARVAEVEVGRHGLKVIHGQRAGLLLPIVAVEQRWDARTFLNQVCRKAGLPENSWLEPGCRLQRFESLLIEGDFDPEAIARGIPSPRERAAAKSARKEWIQRLQQITRANLAALWQGAVPQTFPNDVSDVDVAGIGLQVAWEPGAQRLTATRINPRGGLPLQATLLELCQQAAAEMQRLRWSPAAVVDAAVEILILTSPVPHGPVSSPDIANLDTKQRALAIVHGQRAAVCWNLNASPAELFAATRQATGSAGSTGDVFSFAATCSTTSFVFTNFPQPQSGPDVRPAVVAGTFYPADDAELTALVDRCLKGAPATATRWPAVMVPHAGLIYSGALAARTFASVQIPSRVLILCPKHTAAGMDLAAAPHSVWQIPGAEIAGDAELTSALVAGIEGLQLDSAAHAAEHAIEVELPFLARLAPGSRVAAIAVGALDLAQCLTIGRQLADVIRRLPEPPLLVISSDMNHFATDADNRHLDEMALQAMETLDPERLFQIVQQHRISMCGVRPAVIVMQALRELGQLGRVTRTGYATSGDVTGDRSRVVGYAGALLGPA